MTIHSLLDNEALRLLWKQQRWGMPAWQTFEKGYYTKLWQGYDQFEALPEPVMAWLREQVVEFPLTVIETLQADDQTTKVLFETQDGLRLESVLMRYGGSEGKRERFTVCVSSQVGCPARCAFCATGTMKWSRNLRSDEILAQVLYFNRLLKPRGRRVQNLVFMGMGEPLLNYDEVGKVIDLLLDQRKFALGPRQITLSTVGIVPGIERLLADMQQKQTAIHLAVSLHAPTDAVRTRIVPINKSYPIADLMAVLDRWTAITGRGVLYEYVMLKDLNDTPALAHELGVLLKDREAFVNLIPYNPGPGQFELHPSERENIYAFAEIVRSYGIKTLIRHTFGQDIAAACGQLVVAKAAP